jgi:hypothetical protein
MAIHTIPPKSLHKNNEILYRQGARKANDIALFFFNYIVLKSKDKNKNKEKKDEYEIVRGCSLCMWVSISLIIIYFINKIIVIFMGWKTPKVFPSISISKVLEAPTSTTILLSNTLISTIRHQWNMGSWTGISCKQRMPPLKAFIINAKQLGMPHCLLPHSVSLIFVSI